MLIFKELESAIKSVKRELHNIKVAAGTDSNSEKLEFLLQKKLDALLELLDYVKSGDWASTKKAKERMLYTMQNGNEAAAEKFETTLASVKVSMSQYSTTIRNIIGGDTIQLILDGKVDEGLTQFRCRTGNLTLDTLMLHRPMTVFTKDYDITKEIKLSDCKYEMEVIHKYLDSTYQKDIAQCDKNKLGYLKHLMSTDIGHADERALLVKYLLGDMSITDVLSNLEK